MERIDFVDLKTQYAGLRDEILAGLDHVMSRADFILGEPVRTFERTFAQYLGGPAGYGVASGTDALHLALRACGVGPGDEVITQANTFIATALAISYAGARPVLVDIDPATYLIDVERVRHAITPRTKAIIPVHLFGRAMDLTDLMGLAQHHGLAVIEDACQAHGAALDGRRAGTTGALGCFSFYPGKNLGAYGDGGYVLVNDPRLDAPIAMLRNYGQSKKYHHHILGFNSRLDSVQAVVLNVKLPRLDDWNRQRERLAALYRDRLSAANRSQIGRAHV